MHSLLIWYHICKNKNIWLAPLVIAKKHYGIALSNPNIGPPEANMSDINRTKRNNYLCQKLIALNAYKSSCKMSSGHQFLIYGHHLGPAATSECPFG